MFVGYAEAAKAYRVIDLESGKIKLSRSLVLDEREVDGIYIDSVGDNPVPNTRWNIEYNDKEEPRTAHAPADNNVEMDDVNVEEPVNGGPRALVNVHSLPDDESMPISTDNEPDVPSHDLMTRSNTIVFHPTANSRLAVTRRGAPGITLTDPSTLALPKSSQIDNTSALVRYGASRAQKRTRPDEEYSFASDVSYERDVPRTIGEAMRSTEQGAVGGSGESGARSARAQPNVGDRAQSQ